MTTPDETKVAEVSARIARTMFWHDVKALAVVVAALLVGVACGLATYHALLAAFVVRHRGLAGIPAAFWGAFCGREVLRAWQRHEDRAWRGKVGRWRRGQR
jgi:hypothetical protein